MSDKYEKDWKSFVKNIEEIEDPLPDSPYQKELFKTHPKKKKELIGLGGSKYKGGPYKFKVSYKRSKSAPPIGEAKIKKLLKEFQLMYDYSDFNVKDHLNHNIWGPRGEHVRAQVGNKLIQIANDFFESLKLPEDTELIDIKFTGSLANYNWTQGSDIDLHLVVDFNKISEDKEMLRDYFNAKKSIWNDRHDIMIKGHEVEVYVEDVNERHYSTGVYSLMNNKWLVKPNPRKPIIDNVEVLKKINSFSQKLDQLRDVYSRGEYELAFIKSEQLLDKLKKMRTSGLILGGEFSVENIAYKALRKINFMRELFDIKYDAYDKKMSINGAQNYASNPVKQGQETHSAYNAGYVPYE
tara:strand:- start:267 stop:1325 length:1059 start_codon:yes stop_codon:yes gene_type:complete